MKTKLQALHDELREGLQTSPTYTVRRAVEDWLADGLDGRSAKTVSTYREVRVPLMALIGSAKLRGLTSRQVRAALVKLSADRSTRTLQITRNALVRAIRLAEINDLVGRRRCVGGRSSGYRRASVEVADPAAGEVADRAGTKVPPVRVRHAVSTDGRPSEEESQSCHRHGYRSSPDATFTPERVSFLLFLEFVSFEFAVDVVATTPIRLSTGRPQPQVAKAEEAVQAQEEPYQHCCNR